MNTHTQHNTPEDFFSEENYMAAINSHLDELDNIASDVANLGSSDEIKEIVARLVNIQMSLHFLV